VRALDTVARLGGDEFAVLCEDTTGDDVEAVRERLRAVLDMLRVDGVDDGVVTVSIGAVRAAPGVAARTVLRDADRRMYEQKALTHAGLNQPAGQLLN
jgi:diguanylate cyclase (GGDEF)-like protein